MRPVFWDSFGCFSALGAASVPEIRTGRPVFWAGILFFAPPENGGAKVDHGSGGISLLRAA